MKLSAFLDKLNVRFRRLFSLCFLESHLGTHAINPGGLGAKPPGSLSFFFAPFFFLCPPSETFHKNFASGWPRSDDLAPARPPRPAFLAPTAHAGQIAAALPLGSELCKPKRSGLGFRL